MPKASEINKKKPQELAFSRKHTALRGWGICQEEAITMEGRFQPGRGGTERWKSDM